MKFSPFLISFLTTVNQPPSCPSTSLSAILTDLPPPTADAATIAVSHAAAQQLTVGNERISALTHGVESFLSSSTLLSAGPAPPTNGEIKLLREAFAVFYGVDRDLERSEQLFNQVIAAWQRQPDDEKAGLYRVRGDCYMAMARPQDAEKDYGEAIRLLQSAQDQSDADPTELPAAFLGQARAIRSQGIQVTSEQAKTAATDYQISLRLSAREDWDTDAELEEDGAMRNPYAAWEWGTSLRLAGEYDEAARVHIMASDFFDDIGDRARSVISMLDAGIDLASTQDTERAKNVLQKAIARTTSVEGRDIKLLQRVIAKEGEARIALASVLWDAGNRAEAETQLSTACTRLDQLAEDAIARNKRTGSIPPPKTNALKFSIDDAGGLGPLEIGCSRFKNKDYLSEKLEWPAPLQQKVEKLNSLGR